MKKFLHRTLTILLIVVIAFAAGVLCSRGFSNFFFGGTLLGGNPF